MSEAPQSMDELASFLSREFDAADSYYDTLSTLTNQAFGYYEAQPFGNEIEGRSQIVLPDVQETIDYMQQSVLRTFVSGENTVEFEAVDEADEDIVAEATEGVNDNFMRQQDGFRILHDGLYDGLLKKIGVFKTCSETVEKVSRETVITTEDALALAAEDGAEVEGYQENGDGTVTAALKWTRLTKQFRDYAIPLSEYRFNPKARHEDEAHYQAHVREVTRSDLVEMGVDAEQAYALPMYNRAPESDESESMSLDIYSREENSKALETVLLCEEYALVDVDGDGIAERIKAFRVDTEILIEAETGEPMVDTVDEQPFAVFCPFPRPHRMVGYSLADKVMHIQYQRSFVGRQLFDGLALSNMPRPVVDTTMAEAETYDDILSPIPGSPIRVKGGLASVQPFQTGFDPQKSLAVMEWITGERESLTGITRMNQGLDADALNKTATGTALMQAQGQQNEEAIARQFAETISRLFRKKYRLMRAEGEPFRIKVDGQYKTVDPSQWPEDISVKVKVGLGSNSKDKRIQYRMVLGQQLAQSLQAGLSGPEHVFKHFDGLARDMDIGTGDDFAYDPSQQQEGQEKPDPAMMEMQAKMQQQQAEFGLKQQQAQFDAELRAFETQQRLILEGEKIAGQMDLATYKTQVEAQLGEMKARWEAQRKVNLTDQKMGGSVAS